MGDIRNYDKADLVAEKPEHCFACYRFIQPGQTCYLTVGLAILRDIQIAATDSMRVPLTEEYRPGRATGSPVGGCTPRPSVPSHG